MRNNTITLRQRQGFDIDFNGDWFYEGDIVDITAPECKTLEKAHIMSINTYDGESQMILLKNNTRYLVNLTTIEQISHTCSILSTVAQKSTLQYAN